MLVRESGVDDGLPGGERARAYREHVRLPQPLPQRFFDALVVVLAVATEVEVWVADVPGPWTVVVLAGLLTTLPLLWRRRFPLLAPVMVFAALAASGRAADPRPPHRRGGKPRGPT